MKKAFLISFLLTLSVVLTASADLTVEYLKEDKSVRSQKIGQVEYLSLSDLCQALGGAWYWNPVNKKLVLNVQSRQFKFSLFSPYFQLDAQTYNLSYPVGFGQGDLLAPVSTLLQILGNTLALEVEWEPGDKKIKLTPKELDITSIKVEEKVNGMLLEIFLTRPLQAEIFRTEDNSLHLNFFSAKINPEIERQGVNPVIKEIKVYQFENSCQLSVKLKRPFNKFQDELKDDPLRLRVSLTDTTLSSKMQSQIFSDNIENTANPIDLIVIDPGHGGEDTGAKGPGGVLEKEVVLEISKKVAEALRDKGFKVVLTREEDIFIPLGERTAFANRKGADLFISIHANAAKRKQASGSETYFLSRAKNDEARAVAALENASLRFEKPEFEVEGMEDLDFILLDMVQNEFLKESQDLAALIQDYMEDRLPIPNRGVDQAGFFVLNKAYMPAVLVETAFISNANEAKLLKKDSFQEKIAKAITDAATKFKEKYEKINRAQSQ